MKSKILQLSMIVIGALSPHYAKAELLPDEAGQAAIEADANVGLDAATAAHEGAHSAETSATAPTLASIAPACATAAKYADVSCATLHLLGIDKAQASQYDALLAAIPSMISSMAGSTGNISKTCEQQAKLNKAIAAASAIKGAACLFTMNSCIKACGAALAEPTNAPYKMQIREQVYACKTYQKNQWKTALQTAFAVKGMIQASNCAAETGIAPFPSPTPYTIPNPVAGCDNPQFAATNPVCICAADPKHKICGGGGNDWNAGGGGGGTSNAGGISAPEAGDFGTFGDGEAVDTTQAEAKTQSGAKDAEGGGGGMAGGGGSGGGINGGGGEGGGSALAAPSVITGQSGGAGGANSLIGGSTSGGGGGRKAASEDSDDEMRMLRGLIPKTFADRDKAGMTIQAVDGLTGRMGRSLFEKCSSQVQFQDAKIPFLDAYGRAP